MVSGDALNSRTRIGFVIDLEQTWLGGINYFRNLVTALYEDPDRRMDAVFFIGSRADAGKLADFPTVEIVRTKLLDKGSAAERWRKLLWRVLKKDRLLDQLLVKHGIDVLSHSGDLGVGARTPVASWIPDFQHVHLPTRFTDRERAERTDWFRNICDRSRVVILSSECARADLLNLFPSMQTRSEVLHFVPSVDVGGHVASRADLERRLEFAGPYIYLPNQYWAHKNHQVVVEALALLKSRGHVVQVISTGSPMDYRNPEHYDTLCERIRSLGLDEQYLRLGVVAYRDLIALIRHSVCLINPSLFEGWSTTVEEARAMDKHIILSDIPVHREQAPALGCYFDANDPVELAEAMLAQWQAVTRLPTQSSESLPVAPAHATRRIAFARRYQEIIDLCHP